MHLPIPRHGATRQNRLQGLGTLTGYAAGTATTGTGLLPPTLAVTAAVFLLVGGLFLRRRRHTA